MHQSELDFTNNLRQASPYIAQHRNKTLVIYLPGEFISNHKALQQLCKDVVLLHNLGIKVVLTLGASPQIDATLKRHGLEWKTHHSTRITENAHLPYFQEIIGRVRAQVEAAFCLASAEQKTHVTVVSGNWVIAQPKGIIEGIDFQQTGTLRKINSAIENTLAGGQIALITPLAYSLTGEVFNLNTLDQAFAIASALSAEKLMIFTPEETLSTLPKSLSLQQTKDITTQSTLPAQAHRLLESTLNSGQTINRIHLMPQNSPGALLLELFSRDGFGTLIYTDRYHQLRQAQLEDVAGILNLIQPLQEQGILTPRTQASLELEIQHYLVLEIDQHIIGCAALFPIDNQHAELACLAVDQHYRGQSLGEELLDAIQSKAQSSGIDTLFLLTTHTHHWFIEHGFIECSPTQLPIQRQALYNNQRQSKVLQKSL